MTKLTELRSADEYCHYLAGRHYENFSVVSLVLPRRIRTHLTRIYAFCRTTDELGDESHRLDGAVGGLERLEVWREQVEACFDGRPPIHPVLIALRPTIRECGLEARPFLDLIQANVQDQTVAAYETWKDLEDYCMLSAATVGRMVLRVFDLDGRRAQELSDDVCIGLQLANHAQDVRRDAALGRMYLLQEAMRAGGTQHAVKDLCDRAQRLLRSGEELERLVPLALRIQLALYRLGGLEVVRSIRAMDYRTDIERPAVSTPARLRLLLQALVDGVTRIEHATAQRAA